jgi:hypothetical protein
MTVVTETVETIHAIKRIATESTAQIPVPVAMTVIATTGTAMIVDVQRIGIETEMTATAMIGLTDEGPETTSMTMPEAVNVEGSMMIENGLGQLTIGTEHHPVSRSVHWLGIPCQCMGG